MGALSGKNHRPSILFGFFLSYNATIIKSATNKHTATNIHYATNKHIATNIHYATKTHTATII